MLIKYVPKSGDHLKIVPLIPVGGAAREKKPTRTQVVLFPGTNEVTDDEWAVMQPHIAGELKAGILLTLERQEHGKSGEGEKQPAKRLAELPVHAAEDFVRQCVNPDTLRKWYNEEARGSVRLQLIKRMEKLKIELSDDSQRRAAELEETGLPESSADGAKGSAHANSAKNH